MSDEYGIRRPSRTERLTVRGLEHQLTLWGEPSDSPVVLLHGFMDAGPTWQFLVDCLPDSWSCVAPDWRGFGGSERAAAGYWFPDYLADLEVLLSVLVPKGRARVIAHSMGGNIATLYAGIRPHRLAWLANLEGLGLPRMAPDLAPLRYAQWLEQLEKQLQERHYNSLDVLAGLLVLRNPRLSMPKARFIAKAWTRAAGSGIELASDPQHSRLNPVLYRREEAEACWRRIEIPLLLLTGELSEHATRLAADGTLDYLQRSFPTAHIVTLAGLGHMMHHEDPQAVARHIIEFAAQCGP
jgi:pimeloyl-ACP methyl ester carboxylesterase